MTTARLGEAQDGILKLLYSWLRVRCGPFLIKAHSFANGRPKRRRFHLLSRRWSKRERLNTPSGPVAATVWPRRVEGTGPGLIIVHGSHGPLPLYSFLADRLASRGMTVLVLELPGFGRSPVPAKPWRVHHFTGKEAVGAAFAHLRAHPRVDETQVSLFGHSFGGSVALSSASDTPGLATVIAFGPTRRVSERFVGPAAEERLFWRARFSVSRGLHPWPEDDFVGAVTRAVALEFGLDPWQCEDHPPLLLIDGGLESEKDRAFLAELAEQLAGPVDYRTVPGADHYLNSVAFGRFVAYDCEAVDRFLHWIEQWIQQYTIQHHAERIPSPATAHDAGLT